MKPRPLSEIPAKYHAEIMGQLVGGVPKGVPLPVERPRLRQDTKGPNKTEAAFLAYLHDRYHPSTIYAQAITLTLANGVRYTPDFFRGGMEPTFWETKGFMRDDASVKIKVAARVHPWATFYLVTKLPKKKGGGWKIDRVLP